ncbi:MAG: hypothetical protein QM786_15165 [Breznakibacter sp.]
MRYISVLTITLLALTFSGCRLEIANFEDSKEDLVYLYKRGEDSLALYRYFLGGLAIEVRKTDFHGMQVQERTTYYRNGNVRAYRVYYADSLQYYRLYDEEGVSKKYGGEGILFSCNTCCDTVYQGKWFKKDVFFAYPPHCKIVVMVGVFTEEKLNERDLKKFPIQMEVLGNRIYSYPFSFDSLGENKMVVYWAIEDSTTNNIQKGKIHHCYHVIKSEEHY